MKNYNKNCVVQTQKVRYQIPNGIKQKRIKDNSSKEKITKVKINFNSHAVFGIIATLYQDALPLMAKIGFIGLFILAAINVKKEED